MLQRDPPEMFESPGTGGREDVAERFGDAAGHVLRLAAAAVGGADESSCDVVRECDAVVSPDEVQAEVDTACRAGAGEDLTGVDEEHVLVHVDLRVALVEDVRVVPVRGGAVVIEQPCGGEGECAGGDGCDPGAAVVCCLEGGDHRGWGGGVGWVPVAGHEDGVSMRGPRGHGWCLLRSVTYCCLNTVNSAHPGLHAHDGALRGGEGFDDRSRTFRPPGGRDSVSAIAACQCSVFVELEER